MSSKKNRKPNTVAVAEGEVSTSTETMELVKPTLDQELEAAKQVIADREAKAKELASASIAPAKAEYDRVIADARKTVEEAKAKLNAAYVAAGLKVSGGGKTGPRSEQAKSAISEGARLNKLAGSPKASFVTEMFGKAGYALSWAKRAEKLGMGSEELCERFASDPQGISKVWFAKYPVKVAA